MSATWEGSEGLGRSSDPYVEWDAGYVLGALSPAERLEFEEHLVGCSHCRTAVAEIAGLPGLLAQVVPEDAGELGEASVPPEGPPLTLLPGLLDTAGRQRRRWSRALVGLAAAVLLVLGGVGLGQVWEGRGGQGPEQLAFTALEPTNMTANVRLVPVSAGTEVEVECQYGGTSAPGAAGIYRRYSLVVVDRAGHPNKIKDWDVTVNKVMRPSAPTSLPLAQIRGVEIWETATSEPVLRATR